MLVWNKIFGLSGAEKTEKLFTKWLFSTMLVFGIAGLAASFTLSVEKYHLLQNPDTTLSCSFNIVLNCAPVMKTWQASVFGFPNSLIGVVSYPVVIVIALLGLARVSMPRWFLIGAQIGYTLGGIFAYWLFFQSVYVIQVLCPWCLIVTFSTTILLAGITHYNLRQNTFGFSKQTNKKIQMILNKDFDKLLIASWVMLLVALVILQFGDALLA